MNKHHLIILILLSFLLIKCGTKLSLENQNASDNIFVGKWVYYDTKLFDWEYEFFDDMTYKFTRRHFKDEIDVSKGKYVIGTDNDVFLRSFGSQHWPKNSDTINDYKTSIGSQVLFVYNDTLLINNQEDYVRKYIKQK